jgi:hypothetical protein
MKGSEGYSPLVDRCQRDKEVSIREPVTTFQAAIRANSRHRRRVREAPTQRM